MTTRRDFIKKGTLSLSAIAMAQGLSALEKIQPKNSTAPAASAKYKSQRPELKDRKFTSNAVEEMITKTKAKIKDDKLAWMFENCYPNTLDTTVAFQIKNGKPDTFVITGDIHAMWLRDSSAQVFPYIPLAGKEEKLRQLIAGVIHRQTELIQIDPYANAFNDKPTGSEWKTDMTDMKPELHERKWEIDSLCYPVRLAYHYWKTTNETSVFDDNWKAATALIHQTFTTQQRKENQGPYHFQRVTEKPSDSMLNKGYGSPCNPVGLIYSAFRPSDDATQYGFLIPSNLFAVTSLRQMAEIYSTVMNDHTFAEKCILLSQEVEDAVRKYGIVTHPKYGQVYSFEVDGFGNTYFMDDANAPGLLSIPYLGYGSADDYVYQNTRRLVWSRDNPYFFKGKAGEGIGGPHVGLDMIWPMSHIMRCLTSGDDREINESIRTLRDTDAGTGFMHESFHKDDPAQFTRSWFAWANTLFGELIIKLVTEGKI